MPAVWNASLLFRSEREDNRAVCYCKALKFVCLCVWKRAHMLSQVSIYKWFFDVLLRIFIFAQFYILEISKFFWLLLKLSRRESCTWRSRTWLDWSIFPTNWLFFFFCWCTWNETPIIKLHCQIKTICRHLPILRRSFFPVRLSAHEGNNFILVAIELSK